MTGLVLELQADAMNEGVSVLCLLRKARALSVKLGVTTIDQCLAHEMSGYPTRSSIPDYYRVDGKTIEVLIVAVDARRDRGVYNAAKKRV